MKSWLHEKAQNAAPDDTAMVLRTDMDGLKAINDTFGHAEGDYGIRTVSNVVQSITSNDEICVRTGGDEFCLIGIGKYADDEPQRRTERFLKTLEAVGRSSDKPYEITASIGWASAPYSENVVSELLNTADERMYENKLMRKKRKDAIVISNNLIKKVDCTKVVYVLKNGEKTAVEVETGLSTGSQTEIRSGLNEGDEIVIR